MGRVGEREAAGEHARVAAGELAGVQRDRDRSRSARRAPRRGGRPGAGRASSRCGRRADRAAPARASRTAARCRASPPAAARIRARSSASRSATTARVVRCTRALMRSHQPSSWSWKSSGFANRRPASKLPCRKRWLRSSAPLAWQSPASRITQPSASWPQNARNALGRAALRRDRALAVPDQLARQRPQPRQAAAHPERDVRELLREHQRAGERARVGQLTRHDVAAARLAPADRDLRARLAQIELRQLAGPIDGCAGSCAAAAETAAATRATDHRGSSCRPHSRASRAPRGHARPTASAPQRAAPRSSRRTARASTAAAAAAHRPAASTTPARLRIVSRWTPVRRWISRCERPSTCFNRRISAHSSTPSNALPLVSINRSSQITGPAGRPPTPRQVDHFSTGAGGPVFRRRLQPRVVDEDTLTIRPLRAARIAGTIAGRPKRPIEVDCHHPAPTSHWRMRACSRGLRLWHAQLASREDPGVGPGSSQARSRPGAVTVSEHTHWQQRERTP